MLSHRKVQCLIALKVIPKTTREIGEFAGLDSKYLGSTLHSLWNSEHVTAVYFENNICVWGITYKGLEYLKNYTAPKITIKLEDGEYRPVDVLISKGSIEKYEWNGISVGVVYNSIGEFEHVGFPKGSKYENVKTGESLELIKMMAALAEVIK